MNVRVTRSGATYELISLVRYVYDSHQLSRRSAGFPRRIFWLSSRSTQASCSSRFTTLWAWPRLTAAACASSRSEEHTSELQSRLHLVCRLLLEKKKKQDPT